VGYEEVVDDDDSHEQHHPASPIEVETVVGLGAREALSQQPGPELVLPGARTLAKTVPAPLDLVQDRRAVGRLSRSEAFGWPDVDLDVAPRISVVHVSVDESEADVELVELEVVQRHEYQEQTESDGRRDRRVDLEIVDAFDLCKALTTNRAL